MYEKLLEIEQRFEEVNERLADPNVVNDQEAFKKLMKENKDLTPVVEKFREYKKEKENMDGAKEMLAEGGLDPELKEMAEMEI